MHFLSTFLSEPLNIPAPPPPLPPLKKQDMTLMQLRKYDGHGEDGRVCVAVNGKIYDMTKGKRFYGPGSFMCSNARDRKSSLTGKCFSY